MRLGPPRQRPDAVFAYNDTAALAAMRVCQAAGLRVPEDIAIVGFDDIPEAAYFTPPLTTVRQDFHEVGRHCLLTLLEELETGRRTHRRVVVPTELVVRGSHVMRSKIERLRFRDTSSSAPPSRYSISKRGNLRWATRRNSSIESARRKSRPA
mgnify:CR=1 FL=1